METKAAPQQLTASARHVWLAFEAALKLHGRNNIELSLVRSLVPDMTDEQFNRAWAEIVHYGMVTARGWWVLTSASTTDTEFYRRGYPVEYVITLA